MSIDHATPPTVDALTASRELLADDIHALHTNINQFRTTLDHIRTRLDAIADDLTPNPRMHWFRAHLPSLIVITAVLTLAVMAVWS